MPQRRIIPTPGVNKMLTPTANRSGYADANLVRFRQGLPEKWAGWVKYTTSLLTGVCRSLVAFTTLAGDKVLGAGTNNHLYVYKGGVLYDVTPVDRTVTVNSGGIAVTSGSATVTVTAAAAHGLAVGDYFTFDTISGVSNTPSGITVGGISLAGDYVVAGVSSSTVFTFRAGSNASSTTTYGSSSTVTAYQFSGAADVTPGLGWGAGGWGISAWGTPASVSATSLPARVWSLDNWGQTMVGCASQGRLVAWSPDASGNVATRASYITNGTSASYGPSLINGYALVAMPERHLVCLGAGSLNSTNGYDPMLVRWSDLEDYTTWNATSTNSAGSYRIQGGTKLVAGWNTTLQTLVWSDTHCHLMRFIGLPYVYGFTMLGQNCGLVGQRAFAEYGGAVYWMSARGFFAYSGGAPQPLPCPMIETVFGSLNQVQQSKVIAGVNNTTGEVIWFYPTGSNLEPDSYVSFSPVEAAASGAMNAWSCGTLQRSAWIDHDLLSGPVACTSGGQLYQHETGVDADGAAMGDYIITGYVDMADGEQIQLLTQLAPDFNGHLGTVNVSFLTKDWPNAPTRTRGPYPMTSGTTTRGFRARARQLAMKIESVGTGSWWRLGAMRVNAQDDGQR